MGCVYVLVHAIGLPVLLCLCTYSKYMYSVFLIFLFSVFYSHSILSLFLGSHESIERFQYSQDICSYIHGSNW